jgi:nitrite reductase (NO-forming)
MRETVPVGTAGRRTKEAGPVREAGPTHAPARLFGTGVRVLFGLIWVADVYFKWQPSFLNRLPDVMRDGAQRQPGWIAPWFSFAQGVIALHPTAWAYLIALAETGIALALILGFARKVTYIGGAIYSLMIWSTAEGLGRTSGVATDIGTAIIYAVVFLALVAIDARGRGTRPYSLDAVIERRLPWWRRLAEVRK